MTPAPARPVADAAAPTSPPAQHDPRLDAWLNAAPGPPADRLLAGLMEAEAGPVIARLVRRKFGAQRDSPDAEDVASEARFQLARRLERLRADPAVGPPLADFSAYAAAVTYTAWADHLRRRHPARAMLLNRLRYLLENRAGAIRGFALWPGPDGERLGGFAAWRDAGRGPDLTPRRRWLLVDARAAAADAFASRGEVPRELAALTAGLLAWLGAPLALSDLVNVVAEILDLAEPAAAGGGTPTDAGEPDPGPPDPRPSPHDTLRWKEYLAWLWRETGALPLRQRTAFLLHASLLREMELLGLTSIRAAAVALELPPARLAGLWSRLPLDDLTIAALLGAERQQVINLRKVARATLGRAWTAWIG